MFERIVAAIDGDPGRSANVVAAARELGSALGSAVRVVHVQELERPAIVAATPRPGAVPPVQHDATPDDARRFVDQAVRELAEAGVTAEGIVHSGEGSTSRELLQIADAFQASLIIVGDRGSRVTDVLLGSVAYKLVHSAPCPVLLVR